MDDQELYDAIRRNQERKKNRGKKGGGANLVHQRSHREEAKRLLHLIGEQMSTMADHVKPEELPLLASIEAQLNANQNFEPTDKQIFWLRDIKDRTI